MKKFILHAILIMTLSILSSPVLSQKDVVVLLEGSLKDANTLAKHYLEPLGKSFGTGLNNGWYNTAKPHKLFGFDLTVTASIVIPSSGNKTYTIPNNLEDWTVTTGNNESPTVTGSGNGITLTHRNQANTYITLPKGENLRFIPTPIIQAGVGLPFNTELTGRFIPKMNIGGYGQISLWGVGIKNEFKEFIPGLKALPINVSAFIGYTKLQSDFEISAAQDQNLIFEASGFTGRLLVSKSIPVVTIYAGIGYSKSTTDILLQGDYNVGIPDPISFDITNSGINANIGFRIKLAVIAFHFDYAIGKYAAYNTGVGINFR